MFCAEEDEEEGEEMTSMCVAPWSTRFFSLSSSPSKIDIWQQKKEKETETERKKERRTSATVL